MIYPLVFTGNVASNSVYDVEFYNPFVGNAVAITGASGTFRQASIGSGGTVKISASQGGTAITINLDATTKNRGQTSDDLSISAGTSSIWLRFTNCDSLGDGAVTLDILPTTTVALQGISDDMLTAMLSIRLDRDITPTELSYFIRNAKRKIMNHTNFTGMENSYDLTIVAGTESYTLSTINANFKSVRSAYLLDTDSNPSVEIFREFDRNTFNRMRIESFALDDPDSTDPIKYNIWQDKIWFTPASSGIVRIEYYYYLPDVTGSSTDYFYTNFPQALQYFVLADAELMDKNGDIKKAQALEQLANMELMKSTNAEVSTRYSGFDGKSTKRSS